jgi:hypothetical protein
LKDFEIGHAIDTLHVTMGVFESTIGLLLDITDKMKDGLNTHKDLQALRTTKELHPQERPNGKVYLSPASYTLTNEDKKSNMQVSARDRSPHRILNKHKESGIHVRTESEWL